MPLELTPPCRPGDPGAKSAADRSRSIVLEEYAPPSVVVDACGEVRYYWGTNLPRYLPPQAGAPVTNLMHLVRRELRVELSAALRNAARQGEPVTYRDVVVEAEGDVPQEVQRVLETLEPVERTVGLVDAKRSFLMRMHPYRTPSNVIAGVVISFIDVTELKESEAALRQAVGERERAEQALRDADRRKDEFLAILSHELRNPLAPIRSSLHILERAAPDAEATQRGQEIITRQVGHLARLVDDLLDVTRISRGKLQIERGPLDLRDVAQRTAEDHRSLLTARGVALEIAVPGGHLWIEGDATRPQVIGNLLHNSAKFTSRGDLVRLSLEAVDGFAVLRVRDTGLGIEPAMISRLFQPFTQADTTLNRRLGGLGLGLALVKGLVGAHGGTVDMSSDGKGAGTEFVVRLPLAAAAAVAVAPAAPPRPRRVLVIDDNVDAAESLQLALEMEGHEVTVAHDGPSGLARARGLVPDVVLCDIGLPGMDGYAVAKALRCEPALRDTFIVALTGHALPDDQRCASEAGFDAHLTKPATIARIQEVIGRARRGPPPRADRPVRSPSLAVS